MDFIITIDTEADNQWARPARLTTDNTRCIPRFQSLCDRYGFKPTYLCTYEMVADPLFRQTVGPYQESGRAEIGSHLHPWSTPPFADGEGEGFTHQAFPSELPIDLFERKMQHLTEAIASAFSRSPTSYRAGRYGFDASHVAVLEQLGYLVDCSVAPFMCYAGVQGRPGGCGGPDFRTARPGAYFLDRRDVNRPGDSRLLEVPITILFPHRPSAWWPRVQQWLVDHAGSLPARVLRRCGQAPVWFRPSPGRTANDLLRVYRVARRSGLPCAEMMFHSSELMPGGSPSFPDAPAIEELYRVLERTFEAIAADGAYAVTLTEFRERYRGTAPRAWP